MNSSCDAPLVRRAEAKDALGIHLSHMRSIQEICGPAYTREEIQAWGHRPYDEEQRLAAIRDDFVWVVECEGKIEGHGHLRILKEEGVKRGHIFTLYLTPRVTGRAVGKAVMALMLSEARAAAVKRLTLEATLTAVEFYRKMGFRETGPEITVNVRGTPVRCYPMEIFLP